MPNKLILRITNNSQKPIEWFFLDKNGVQSYDLAQYHIDDEIFVFVPSTDVFLTTVNLPKLSSQQLQKAIPYALEEQLAENMLNIHFGMGELITVGDIPVAVVSKEKMALWKALIEEFLKFDKPNLILMTPETLTLPYSAEHWTIALYENSVLVRTGLQAGFGVELEDFWPLLQIILQNTQTVRPQRILFSQNFPIPEQGKILLDGLKIPYQPIPMPALDKLLANYRLDTATINLLQGPYKIARYSRKNKWWDRSALLLVMILLSILMIFSVAKIIILNSTVNQLNHAIIKEAHAILPNQSTKNIRLIKTQIKQEIATLEKYRDERGFIGTLSKVASQMSLITGIKILTLDYSEADHELTLQLEAEDFALLDKLYKNLQLPNYTITLSDAKKSGEAFQANLKIEEKRK